jgi:hypothetical protein
MNQRYFEKSLPEKCKKPLRTKSKGLFIISSREKPDIIEPLAEGYGSDWAV